MPRRGKVDYLTLFVTDHVLSYKENVTKDAHNVVDKSPRSGNVTGVKTSYILNMVFSIITL